jgi:hypothetical protein
MLRHSFAVWSLDGGVPVGDLRTIRFMAEAEEGGLFTSMANVQCSSIDSREIASINVGASVVLDKLANVSTAYSLDWLPCDEEMLGPNSWNDVGRNGGDDLGCACPIDGYAYSDCAGESIYVTGEAHYLVTVTEDGAGGYHGKYHVNIKGVGVGEDSGDKYQYNGVMNEEINVAAGEEETLTESVNLIGQGKAANMVLKWDAHITVNANGDVTVYRDNERIDCH